MLTPGKIYVNTGLRLTEIFRDLDGDLVDPSTVTFKTFSPCCVQHSYVYGTDSEVIRVSAGKYAADIQPDEVGRWRWRWETTGTGTLFAVEGDFLIQDSPFAPWSSAGCCDYRWWW